jgi:hypothetical protein
MCSGNLASYSNLFDRSSNLSRVQDAERVKEELQFGMEALGRSIQADIVCEGLANIAKEAEKMYMSTFMD